MTTPVIDSEKALDSTLLPKVDLLDFPQEFDKFIQALYSEPVVGGSIMSDDHKRKFNKRNLESIGQDQNLTVDMLPSIRNYFKDFELVLSNDIDQPLCKGKYLVLQLMLKPCRGILFPENETIDVNLLVYTTDNKLITKNMKGLDIIKGNSSHTMHFFKPANTHVAYFLFQITDVSSHYPKKLLTLKFQPKSSPFLQSTGYRILPLVIPNLKIRAKKMHK